MSAAPFQQRSYSGKCFRPKPLVDFEAGTQSIIVATSWNGQDAAADVVKTIKESLVLASDPEATGFGQYTESLGLAGNRLRSAAGLANDALYFNVNKNEYVAGVELAALSFSKNTLAWAQVGAPHLFLVNKAGIQPLSYTPDWSWQIHQGAPLMCQSLGLERSVNLNCGSYRLESGDQVILLSRSYVPSAFYGSKKVDVDELSKVLVADSEAVPFWIGILQT